MEMVSQARGLQIFLKANFSSMKKISIIIVNFNNYRDLTNCLESIYKFNDIDERLEVIVVDNSTEKCFDINFYTEYSNIKMIRSQNLGFGYSNNIGALNSKSEYLMFFKSGYDTYRTII